MPVKFTLMYKQNCTSPVYDFLCLFDWGIAWSPRDCLRISSVSSDQQLVGPTSATIAYEGFVTVEGRLAGKSITRYSVVQMGYLEIAFRRPDSI
jgi:hypothetical protein